MRISPSACIGIIALLVLPQGSEACTVFVAGKEATVDGSVLVSHSNDGEFDTDPRLVKIPAATYPSGAMRPVYFSPAMSCSTIARMQDENDVVRPLTFK